ncbi:hypothetical protein BD410DRAFT_144806 [Rickenella mellea]|uniref:Velvet domain-containing protein n=1 Tax=Rickenella mellea TaxID=50990 RepID=A0A4Y7Q7N4_9AGAM|nr:hypothetical protein BD410DRAFT_144806 [Rickenella mellea]
MVLCPRFTSSSPRHKPCANSHRRKISGSHSPNSRRHLHAPIFGPRSPSIPPRPFRSRRNFIRWLFFIKESRDGIPVYHIRRHFICSKPVNMSNSNNSGNPLRFPRPRSNSVVDPGDASQARASPLGRERIAIHSLASGGHAQFNLPSGSQSFARPRTSSSGNFSPRSRRPLPTSPLGSGHASATMSMPRPDPRGRIYELRVVQHPERSAEFGMNELSRLPLAPPLIVQLIVRDHDGTPIGAEDEAPFLVAHLSLFSADGNRALDSYRHPTPQVRLLYGTLVSSLQCYKNLQHQSVYYFIFPDVSIRSRGQYRLQITLLRLSRVGAAGVVAQGEAGGVLATALTNAFNVVPQVDYIAPQLTQLTQWLIQQGARMTCGK